MTPIHAKALPIVLLAFMPALAAAQDGSILFKQRCAACHSVQPGAKATGGPNLNGIVGREAAKGAYPYSPALKGARIRWNARTLDTWLAGPSKMVPGTRMYSAVPSAEDRKKIIAFLSGVKSR